MARVSRRRASRLARRQAATVCGLPILTFMFTLMLGLGAPSMAQTDRPPDPAAWARCQEAPTRRCVLGHALEIATTLRKAPPGKDQPPDAKAMAEVTLGLGRTFVS